MRNRTIPVLLFLAVICAASPRPVHAAALTLVVDGSSAFAGDHWTLGYLFTPTQDIWVTRLGQWDQNHDGLGAAVQVGIWRESDQALLTSTTLAATATGAGDGFAWASLSGPLHLVGGTQYSIGGFGDVPVFISNSSGYPGHTVVFDPVIAASFAGRWSTANAFTWMNNDGFPVGQGYVGPNFDFVTSDPAAIPEPASMVLLGTGVLGAGLRRWRQQRQRSRA